MNLSRPKPSAGRSQTSAILTLARRTRPGGGGAPLAMDTGHPRGVSSTLAPRRNISRPAVLHMTSPRGITTRFAKEWLRDPSTARVGTRLTDVEPDSGTSTEEQDSPGTPDSETQKRQIQNPKKPASETKESGLFCGCWGERQCRFALSVPSLAWAAGACCAGFWRLSPCLPLGFFSAGGS